MKNNIKNKMNDEKLYVPLDKIADIFRKKGIKYPKGMWYKTLELIKTWSEYETEFIYSFLPSDFENLVTVENYKTPLEIRLRIRQLLIDYPNLKKRNDILRRTLENLQKNHQIPESHDSLDEEVHESRSQHSSETEKQVVNQTEPFGMMTAEVAFSLRKEYRGNATRKCASRYRIKAPRDFFDNDNLIFTLKDLNPYFGAKGKYSKEQMLAVILILVQEYGCSDPSEAYTFGSRELKELFSFFGCKSHAEERQAIITAAQETLSLLEENSELEQQIKNIRNESEKTKTKKKELGEIAIGKTALRGIVDISGAENTSVPLVQKSHALMKALFNSEFNLLQLKLIDCYLRRINTHQPETREVAFEKAELETLLGGKRVKADEIAKALSAFKEKIITVVKSKESGEIDEIPLFNRAEIGYFSGRLLIDLECSEAAIPYLYNLEENGYIKFSLMMSLSIPNIHTYLLYMYLLSNRYRGHWQVDLLALRSILGCETIYPQYFLFNEKVMKNAHAKITADCGLQYIYREVKRVDQTLIAFQIISTEDTPIPLPDNDGKSATETASIIHVEKLSNQNTLCSWEEDIPISEDLMSDMPF